MQAYFNEPAERSRHYFRHGLVTSNQSSYVVDSQKQSRHPCFTQQRKSHPEGRDVVEQVR